jgi:hypothetical protein
LYTKIKRLPSIIAAFLENSGFMEKKTLLPGDYSWLNSGI